MEKQKIDNKYLLEKQLETLKLFLERNLITKDSYDYFVIIGELLINVLLINPRQHDVYIASIICMRMNISRRILL